MQDNSDRFPPERISLFPAMPGVYVMKNRSDRILYIGKARNIRTRIRTYFSKTGDGRASVAYFLPRVRTIETIVTENEKEAFLLENILIKKHQPPYNIRLRDDKTYISLRIDPKKDYPRLEWIRKRKKDGALYFGPYSSASSVRHTVRFLETIFPLRTCSDNVMKNRSRPCIRHQMKRCLAPCTFPVDPGEYRKMIKGVILYLRGNMEELKKRLKSQMKEHSDAMRFEKARELRDRIAAIDLTLEKQSIADQKTRDIDVIAHHLSEGTCAMVVLRYRMGVLSDTRSFFFKQRDRTVSEIYYAFLGQFYGENVFIPGRILVGALPEEQDLIEEWLSDLRESRTVLSLPRRGRPASLLRLAENNARESVRRKLEGERDFTLILQSLQRKLHLPEPPFRIEGFDISNIQGRLAVGSMVVFTEGKPDPREYRRFKIKTVSGSDDFAMMYEVVKRRYKRLKEEERTLPNLILIDGGKGQLNAAIRALDELDLAGISIIGLAKSRLKENRFGSGERRPTPERVFLPGRKNPVFLKPGSPSLILIQKVRDEAHRFAITYHKKLRSRAQRRSILDEIPGIGPSRKRFLLRHFGSLRAIRGATLEDICDVPGMNRTSAENVRAFLSGRNPQKGKNPD